MLEAHVTDAAVHKYWPQTIARTSRNWSARCTSTSDTTTDTRRTHSRTKPTASLTTRKSAMNNLGRSQARSEQAHLLERCESMKCRQQE